MFDMTPIETSSFLFVVGPYFLKMNTVFIRKSSTSLKLSDEVYLYTRHLRMVPPFVTTQAFSGLVRVIQVS